MILKNILLESKNWILNYGVIKFLIGSFVFYLLIDEFNMFLFKKPTQTSFSETYLHPEDNPDILICMNPGYDKEGFR